MVGQFATTDEHRDIFPPADKDSVKEIAGDGNLPTELFTCVSDEIQAKRLKRSAEA